MQSLFMEVALYGNNQKIICILVEEDTGLFSAS